MPERIRYKSPEELQEEEIESKIKEKNKDGEMLGGVVYEEEADPETGELKRYIFIGNPYSERPSIVKLETQASREDIEAIKQELIPMVETYEMLTAMAEAYQLREPLLIEGGTALGKTYTVNKFTELLYGHNVAPLDFYCNGQTDVSELMAKWVPKTASEEDRAKIAELFKQTEEDDLPSEKRLEQLESRLQALAESGQLSEKTQWHLQYGALPKAMSMIRNSDGSYTFDDKNGDGFILHIEEVGLAEPQVTNALLKIRGTRGKLTNEIQLWENGGRKIKAGKNFWVVLTTNPPEEYGSGRNEIDAALARGVVFKRMGDLSPESLNLVADHYFNYKFGRPQTKPEGCLLDIYNHSEICNYLDDTIAAFHREFKSALKDGEKGRQQKVPVTLDDMARVAERLIKMQVRSRETGFLDLTETIRRAIHNCYLNRLADPDLKQTMTKNLEELLSGVTGQVNFRGQTITRKALFDQLVAEASMGETGKQQAEQQEQERKQRELEQARFAVEDQFEKLLNNPKVPDSIKNQLKG